MARDYTPPEDLARTAARLERNTEAGKKLKQELHDLAVRELRAGATVGQLAKHLPWSAETLRGIARKAQIPLRREPTVVGKRDTEATRAEVEALRRKVAELAAKSAPPHTALPTPQPITLSDPQARNLADLARSRATPAQLGKLAEAARTARKGDEDFAVVEVAYRLGLVTDADIA